MNVNYLIYYIEEIFFKNDKNTILSFVVKNIKFLVSEKRFSETVWNNIMRNFPEEGFRIFENLKAHLVNSIF